MQYAIWWRSWENGKMGHGPAVFSYHTAMKIALWLNRTYPRIEHWAAIVPVVKKAIF